MAIRSEINEDVLPAQEGEFAPLLLTEETSIWPPVVLAPMAGVTNPPFRRLCRQMGAGLYVAEMVHSRGLADRNARSLKMASFAADESFRSLQIFGADPTEMAAATSFLVEEVGVDHIDINMGCPVRKITGRGCGSALPARPRLMGKVLSAVVRAAGEIPVTTKIRLGLDDDRLTWRDALQATTDSGCRWMGVHGRTAQDHYGGLARWDEIAKVKEASSIPILGNGDIWECWDALRMMRQTGCDGVIIGRGCLGRPWLFRELAQVFNGQEPDAPPSLGEVTSLLLDHARLLVEYFGDRKGILEMRKWCTWYTKGFEGSAGIRQRLQHIDSLDQMAEILAEMDPSLTFPQTALRVIRGKRGGDGRQVHLPHQWLESEEEGGAPPAQHSAAVPWSGG